MTEEAHYDEEPTPDEHGFYWDKQGRGQLFHPNTGTGMIDDPISANRRIDLTAKLFPEMPESASPDMRKALGKLYARAAMPIIASKIPLQHLADLNDMDMKIALKKDYDASAAFGTIGNGLSGRIVVNYTDLVNPNKAHIWQRTMAHEIGHAKHWQSHPQYWEHMESANDDKQRGVEFKGGTADPIVEGIADGYADRYSGIPKGMSVSGYPKLFKEKSPEMQRLYSLARSHVNRTGNIPLANYDRIEHALTSTAGKRRKRGVDENQLKLDLEGM